MTLHSACQARDDFMRFLLGQLEHLKHLKVVEKDEDFVEAIQILRRTGGSQTEIARHLEVSPGTITRWGEHDRLPTKRSVRTMYHELMVQAMSKLIDDVAEQTASEIKSRVPGRGAAPSRQPRGGRRQRAA